MMVPLLNATVMKYGAHLDPHLEQSPPPPSPSSSALMEARLGGDFWQQFAAQPVSPQMLLVSNDQIDINCLCGGLSSDSITLLILDSRSNS